MFWLKSELILEKIRKTSDSLARRRRASESPASQDSQRPQKMSEETGRRKFLKGIKKRQNPKPRVKQFNYDTEIDSG